MSSDSMESQFSCAALPDLRSGQSSRRPPPRRGSTRNAATSPLPLPLACEERRGASDHCGRRSRAPQHRLRRKRRTFRWGAMSCGGPPGLGGDVYSPIWTTISTKSAHHGVRSSTLETTTWTGNSCARHWWNLCDKNFPKSCDCTRAGTPPMDHEIFTEYNPWHTQVDPSLRTARVCELEGKQWCTDQHVLEISCASQWWNPCDDEDTNTGGCKRVPCHKMVCALRRHSDSDTCGPPRWMVGD